MFRLSAFGIRWAVLALLLVVAGGWSPATEKYDILGYSDLVFVGKASGFHRTIILSDWRLMWAFTAEIEVHDVLKGSQELKGKRISYLFRCGGCSLLEFPMDFPDFAHEDALWFVRKYGSGWEAAYGASIDAGVRQRCDTEDYRTVIQGEPSPRPGGCFAESQ